MTSTSPTPSTSTRRTPRCVALGCAVTIAVAASGCAAQAATPPASSRAASRTHTHKRVTGGADRLAHVARLRWDQEQYGSPVHKLLRRVAADPTLRAAVRSGQTAAIRRAVDARFTSAWYHWHVSRLRIVRKGHNIVDVGVPFVVAPSSLPLRNAAGKTVATLQISDQDVIGYVRYMRRNEGVDIVARGVGRAHVKTSLPAALKVTLPKRGHVTIRGRRYAVRSFTKHSLDREPVRIWVLVPA